MDFAALNLEGVGFALPEGGSSPVFSEAAVGTVGLLTGTPGGVVYEAHGAEGFNESNLLPGKLEKGVVPGEQCVELGTCGGHAVGQQEPEVLNCGACAHIVEIEQVESFVGVAKDIAMVAVAMEADHACVFEEGGEFIDQSLDEGAVGSAKLRGERARGDDELEMRAG